MTTADAYATLSSQGASNARLEQQASGENLQAVVDALPLQNEACVLEIGCGSGALAREIASRIGTHGEFVGLDLSAEHISYAAAEAARAGLMQMRFVQGDGYAPDAWLEGRFHLVYCRYLLMYAMTSGRAPHLLAEMARCVRPGGVLACIEADINFGANLDPGPNELLASVMQAIVPFYRARGGIEWRAGLRLYRTFASAGLEPVDIRLIDGRILQGGEPRGLVLHDGMDLENLIAPVAESLGGNLNVVELAEQWRAFLSDQRSFIYTPIFLATWTKMPGEVDSQ